ncbi:MAG: hypothetical protein K8S87_00955 [Planctomycetes bacterium]|nr:hypothetical protein [Planctomycetota bacterium]
MHKSSPLLLLLMLVSTLICAGCGYIWSSHPFADKSSSRYIQLNMFENFTIPYQAGLEIRLDKAVSEDLMKSAYCLVSNNSIPDVSISGRIIDHSQKVLSTSPEQIPTEISLSITILVRFRFKSGWEVEHVIKSDHEPYAIVLGEKRENAEKRVLQETARKILLLLSDVDVPSN